MALTSSKQRSSLLAAACAAQQDVCNSEQYPIVAEAIQVLSSAAEAEVGTDAALQRQGGHDRSTMQVTARDSSHKAS